MELNCVEEVLKEQLSKKYSDRLLTIGRTAHITEGTKEGVGRVSCQYRNRCMRDVRMVPILVVIPLPSPPLIKLAI